MQYQFAPSPLGYLLLAEQHPESGLSLLYIGEEPEHLLTEAQAGFPGHHWQQTERLMPFLEPICSALINKTPFPELPLNPTGTAFQQQVWQALLRIPFGTTISYSELAEAVGRPSSVRAVASACGANEISLLIPCHRVVRKNGELSGYRWGVERKRQLLAMESGAGSWAKENQKGIKAYNEFVEDNGLFGEEDRPF